MFNINKVFPKFSRIRDLLFSDRGFIVLLSSSLVIFLLFLVGNLFLTRNSAIKGVFAYDPYFGDGSDGSLVVSTNTIDAPIDSAVSGNIGSLTLAANNPNFSAGQLILIHQTQGGEAGIWEINQIVNYNPGTITLAEPLKRNYPAGAQALVLKEYTDVTINSGVSLQPKAWNGSVGGILAFLANGTVTVTGTITASNTGFRGGNGNSGPGDYWTGYRGEGQNGDNRVVTTARDGAAGGGSFYTAGNIGIGAGGGANGTDGTVNNRSDSFVQAGLAYGSIDLTILSMGGAGGGSSAHDDARIKRYPGGNGGGIIFITANTLTLSGSIVSNGQSPIGSGGDIDVAEPGAGSGGSILLKAKNAGLGTNLIKAIGGIGAIGNDIYKRGGNGGEGRIFIEYCDTLSGNFPPSNIKHITCMQPTPSPKPNESPIAVAGTSLDSNGGIILDGSLSVDSDGSIVSYSWKIDEDQNLRTGQKVPIADLVSGQHTIQLTVTDDQSTTNIDTMLLAIPSSKEQGAIISKNSNFSTSDTNFELGDTLYMKFRTNQVDYSNIKTSEWKINNSTGLLTNNLDGSYSAQLLLNCNVQSLKSGNSMDLKLNITLEDNIGNKVIKEVTFTLTNNGISCNKQ